MLAIALFLAAVMAVVGTTLLTMSRPHRPSQRSTRRLNHVHGIGDEAERWLRDQAPGLSRPPGGHWWYRATWFEGTGPFLWPAAYFAVLGGLLWLAGLYNPGELAVVTVVVPLAIALSLVVGAYCHQRRRRARRKAAKVDLSLLFGEEAIARMLDRRRRGE